MSDRSKDFGMHAAHIYRRMVVLFTCFRPCICNKKKICKNKSSTT